ncbi:MAG TPA: helix-turn-helix transcriptional regulator [Stellaceae bacterium]|jgi:AraC-like DNA-binding protein|nr:helix-turn-helix transcriptional regulator [Stellaceae bacterium]
MSVFSEPDDFEAALGEEGCLGLLITGRGLFRARLTQIALHRLRLSAAEEQLSRIGFIVVPADMVLMWFPIGGAPSPVWGGVGMRAGEIMIVGPGQRLHARTAGPCRWGAIWLPVEELIRYGRALTGAPFGVPSGAQYRRPAPANGTHLHHLHAAAIRMAQIRPQALVDAEAAHGLEQQLIHALIKCLPAGMEDKRVTATDRCQDILSRFEDLLKAQPNRNLHMAEICAALSVSDHLLRSLCLEHLGLGPTAYIRVRRMSLARRDLWRGNHGVASVSGAARRHGFHDGGRFAASYRELFGELPSVTLRRSLRAGTADLARRRMHLPV